VSQAILALEWVQRFEAGVPARDGPGVVERVQLVAREQGLIRGALLSRHTSRKSGQTERPDVVDRRRHRAPPHRKTRARRALPGNTDNNRPFDVVQARAVATLATVKTTTTVSRC
jgi:hypothetical protein